MMNRRSFPLSQLCLLYDIFDAWPEDSHIIMLPVIFAISKY